MGCKNADSVQIVLSIRIYYIKADKHDTEKALLASNLKNPEAEIIISILKAYKIPFLKESKEIGATEIITGTNLYGIDIYVPPDMLQTAKELLNTDNIVFEQEDTED